ncbi:Myb/SANT-like domain-containing protein [Tanacetum coccineum]
MTDSSLPSGTPASRVYRGAGKNKRAWTADEDAKLIDALMELHESGKYSGADNGFKPGYDKAVQTLLDVSLPNSGLKADPHIRSRLKTLKNNFCIVHDMLSGTGETSGFGWDPEKCVLTAPEDVWAAYIKEKKHATPFKDKALPYYDKLCTIFGKDRATGGRAEDLGDDEIVQETPPVFLLMLIWMSLHRVE